MCRFWCVQNRSKNVEGVDHFECKCAPFGRLLCRPWTRFGTDFEPDLGPILDQIWAKTGTRIGPKLIPELVQNWYRNWAKLRYQNWAKLVPDLAQSWYQIWYRFRTRFGLGLGSEGRNLRTSHNFGPLLVPDNTEPQIQNRQETTTHHPKAGNTIEAPTKNGLYLEF